jgi:hypothetical protein
LRHVKVPMPVHLQSLHPQVHMKGLHQLIRSARGRGGISQSLKVRCHAPIRHLLTILLIPLRVSLARLSKILDVQVPNERGLQRRKTTQARLLEIIHEPVSPRSLYGDEENDVQHESNQQPSHSNSTTSITVASLVTVERRTTCTASGTQSRPDTRRSRSHRGRYRNSPGRRLARSTQ